MENTPTTIDNTNIKTQDNTDGFNIPVSTSSSPAASSAPIVSDFKPASSSPSTSDVKPVDTSAPKIDEQPADETTAANTPSEPAASFDFDKMNSPSSEPTKEFKPKLSAPIRAQNYSNKGSKFLTFLLVIILVAVIVGGIYGVYNWQHSSVTQLTTENQSLSAQLAAKESQLSAVQKQLAAAQPTQTTTIDFSALGISLSVPSALKDITTETKANPTKLAVAGASVTPTEINLSSTTLVALDSSCSTSNAALGVLSKTSGTYPSSPTATNSSGTLVEQFSGYYIAYTAPLACSKVSSTISTQTTLVKALQASLIKANITVL